MPYAAYTTIPDLLPGVTITTGYTTAAQNAMTMASNLIDHHLSKRYSVPFTTVPPLVVDMCKKLGAYYYGRAIFTQDAQNTNDWIAGLREEARGGRPAPRGNHGAISTDAGRVQDAAERLPRIRAATRQTRNPQPSEAAAGVLRRRGGIAAAGGEVGIAWRS